MINAAVNPDEAVSKEHWMASFGVFLTGAGARGISAPKNTGAPTTNSKVNSPDEKSTVPAAQANSATPKLPTLTNIREWYRVNVPEMGLVQDGMGGYHFAVKKGDGSGHTDNKRSRNNGEDKSEARYSKDLERSKPIYSPNPERWKKKGGKIEIDENETWIYTNNKGQSVSYPDGYPDFTPYMHQNIKPVEIEIAKPTNRPLDYRESNLKAGLNKDSDPPVTSLNRPPAGYVWHHHQDGKTMMLVDKKIHAQFTHAGGISTINGK